MSNYICEELIVDIFTRLPSKSLLRFRSVSKSLRSCIENPSFIRMHTSQSPQKLVITHAVTHKYVEEYGVETFCTLHEQKQLPLCPIRAYIGITPIKFPRIHDDIVGSWNGILCLFDYDTCIISLWNPSIRRQLILPDCPIRCIYGVQIGFGFDPITNDNKIVCVPMFGEVRESCFVYTMKTGSWRPVASLLPSYSKVLSNVCYVNGVLHWIVERVITDSEDKERCYIMTFNLCTHAFGIIDLPKLSWGTQMLTSIEECLGVISSWIWVRRDGCWYVVFKSQKNQVEGGLNNALELPGNGDLLLDTICGGFQVYNSKTRSRSSLMDFNSTSFLIDMHMYVESLELLGMGTACQKNHLFLEDKRRKQFRYFFQLNIRE